jgi:ribosomal protein S6--L-glutamate ligase
MDILILSRNVAIYSTRRLTEAFRARGRRATVLDPTAVSLLLGGDAPEAAVSRGPLPLPRVCVPRIGPATDEHALSVLRHLEAVGVPLTAPSRAVQIARDKAHSLRVLADAGLPVPRTALVRQEADVAWAIDAVGGLPVVLKFPRGTHGVGVFLAESIEGARTVLEAMWGLERNLLVQRYVSSSAGRDIRLFVVGDEVVAAIRRKAPEGSFRSNLHHGGRAEAFDPPDSLGDLALRAAGALGLPVAGIDVLLDGNSPLIIEANSSPGLEGIEDATGIDVAGTIADCALRLGGETRT